MSAVAPPTDRTCLPSRLPRTSAGPYCPSTLPLRSSSPWPHTRHHLCRRSLHLDRCTSCPPLPPPTDRRCLPSRRPRTSAGPYCPSTLPLRSSSPWPHTRHHLFRRSLHLDRCTSCPPLPRQRIAGVYRPAGHARQQARIARARSHSAARRRGHIPVIICCRRSLHLDRCTSCPPLHPPTDRRCLPSRRPRTSAGPYCPSTLQLRSSSPLPHTRHHLLRRSLHLDRCTSCPPLHPPTDRTCLPSRRPRTSAGPYCPSTLQLRSSSPLPHTRHHLLRRSLHLDRCTSCPPLHPPTDRTCLPSRRPRTSAGPYCRARSHSAARRRCHIPVIICPSQSSS